jgi:flagellar motor switch protein FliN/FliY
LASDISNILQSEIINTFESLLSVSANIEDINNVNIEDISSNQLLVVKLELKNDTISSILTFIMPTLISTKFEYFMLGGIGELKNSIDDEIVDAVKEIVSTIGGSLSTAVNAQEFDDLSNISTSLLEANSISKENLEAFENLYKINLRLNEEHVEFYIAFEENLLPYVAKFISGEKIEPEQEEATNTQIENNNLQNAALLNILGEDSIENLKLLFDVQLKLSVRLGSKIFLLKDIINWDIGHIIELEQMVNEPLDILVNGVKVGEGEAVVVEGKFGIKIKYIGERLEVENG